MLFNNNKKWRPPEERRIKYNICINGKHVMYIDGNDGVAKNIFMLKVKQKLKESEKCTLDFTDCKSFFTVKII